MREIFLKIRRLLLGKTSKILYGTKLRQILDLLRRLKSSTEVETVLLLQKNFCMYVKVLERSSLKKKHGKSYLSLISTLRVESTMKNSRL